MAEYEGTGYSLFTKWYKVCGVRFAVVYFPHTSCPGIAFGDDGQTVYPKPDYLDYSFPT